MSQFGPKITRDSLGVTIGGRRYTWEAWTVTPDEKVRRQVDDAEKRGEKKGEKVACEKHQREQQKKQKLALTDPRAAPLLLP